MVKNPRIIIGDYTYYDDVDGADQFEKHVTHFYDFIGDKLIIGKLKGDTIVGNDVWVRLKRLLTADGLALPLRASDRSTTQQKNHHGNVSGSLRTFERKF